MKKAVTLLMVLCLSMGALVGCGSKSTSSTGDAKKPAKDDKLTIYGIYKAGDQTWFIDEGNAAKAKTEELGGQFIYVDAKMNPEECLKAVDNAIANKADGIVICVPDQTMSQAVVDKCKAANIPVVSVDDALEVDGKKIAPWVGIDGYSIGQANGEWMANYMKTNNLVDDKEVGVMMLTMDTVSSCVPRTKGESDKFKEILPNFDAKRIYKADNDGTTDKGNSAATAVITAHPEIKKWMVMSANEESAMGAVRALETAGLDKNSCVIGLGAYLAKDEWNQGKNTCMKASCYFSADSIGGTSIQLLFDNIKNGKEIPMSTAVPATICTPENYKKVMGAAA
ncbi:MAG TPA: LacI family transcriptional regulator, partial [Clostridiaceae bacterium]|nr:LacI family transcriptional regulator [Clostridiaceae bacterium]